jgi:hypothetical protein
MKKSKDVSQPIDRDTLPSSIKAAIHDAEVAGGVVEDSTIEELLAVHRGEKTHEDVIADIIAAARKA